MQSYTYDAVNRLGTFVETGATVNQTYGFDAVGNRWISPGWIDPKQGLLEERIA